MVAGQDPTLRPAPSSRCWQSLRVKDIKYNFLARFRLPRRQGDGCLRARQHYLGLLGGRDRLKLPGCRGLGPARGGDAGKCLFTVWTFVAFIANAEVAVAAAAAAVAMVTRAAGARIRNKLK